MCSINAPIFMFAISFVCREVVRWLERYFVLATCQEKRKALNSLVHQEKASGGLKNLLNNVLNSSSFIHLPQSFLRSFRSFLEQEIFK